MPACLFDTNIWLAVVFPSHPCHGQATGALRKATAQGPAVFCRSTQQSFLRLVTTPALQAAYGAQGLTNSDAWVALDALLALPQVHTRDEPPGLMPLWRSLAQRDTASPKIWMDAYLAAFAIAGGVGLATLDRDFRQFEVRGLALELLAV